MPRIYSPNEDHNFVGGVDFVFGAAAVAYGSDVGYFTAEGYDIDSSKHEMTPWDKLSTTRLEEICAYLGIVVDAEDTKQDIVRNIEGFVSTALLTELSITSIAGTAVGDTNITSDPADGQLVYIIGAEAQDPYYFDDVSHWTPFESGDDITAATGTVITVAKVNDDGLAIAAGHATVTAKAE